MELARESSGSARSVFWTSLFLCGLGLIPVIWRFGFDWAMTLEWVKGKEWKAGALVIVGALAVIGIVVSIFEEASKPKGRDG